MCEIKFSDGTTYIAKSWSGTCVVSNEALDFSAKNLKNLVIIDGEETITFVNAKQNGTGYNALAGEYYYAIAEMSQQEIAQAKNDAQVLYTAMMTDSLLEE